MADNEALTALLKRCARQDHAAFERLYDLSSAKLFSVCRYLLRNDELAEEALQEAYVQIWRDAASFRPERAAAMTWLSVITRHRCLDLLRRRRAETTVDNDAVFDEQIDDDPGPLELTARWAERHALGKCLETLSKQQRESINLAFFRGLSHSELSKALATPIGTVKSWIRRGLERLQRCLQQ